MQTEPTAVFQGLSVHRLASSKSSCKSDPDEEE